MARVDAYRSVAKYYLRLKIEEAAKLAYKKGDMEKYDKYQKKLKSSLKNNMLQLNLDKCPSRLYPLITARELNWYIV